MASEVCELPDGRRIRYFLKKRKGRPCCFACFVGRDDKRHESSTSERNLKRAQESAIAVIRDAYATKIAFIAWDDAMKLAVRHMKANNLRGTTIQQYELAVKTLRKVFPKSAGPSDITPAMAEQFKVARLEQGRKPRTVENDIGNLNIVYGHWFRHTLKVVEANPFADVEPPRYDKATPRYIEEKEQEALFKWITKRWGWRLPILFLETKAAIGCRIGELSAALTCNLQNSRLYFTADATKGREARACLLPANLYQELQAIAGPTYLFEGFSEELRAVYRAKGNRYAANAIKEFTPARLKRWIQDAAKAYFDTTKAPRFKLHNFRGTAMSKARLAGISYDDAAVAFDCDPRVMQQHYAAFDKASIADRVFGQIQNGSNRGAHGRMEMPRHNRPVAVRMGTARPRRLGMGAHMGARNGNGKPDGGASGNGEAKKIGDGGAVGARGFADKKRTHAEST